MTTTLTPGQVDLATLETLYRETGIAKLDQSCIKGMEESAATLAAAAKGEASVYGVNTGSGKLANKKIAPDDVATLHLFWDIRNLNLSVFWKHRSEYFQPNDGGTRVHRWFDDTSYLDASISYRIDSVWKLRFTAQNLTDEAQWGQRGLRHDAPTLWNSSGTRYELGVTATWD